MSPVKFKTVHWLFDVVQNEKNVFCREQKRIADFSWLMGTLSLYILAIIKSQFCLNILISNIHMLLLCRPTTYCGILCPSFCGKHRHILLTLTFNLHFVWCNNGLMESQPAWMTDYTPETTAADTCSWSLVSQFLGYGVECRMDALAPLEAAAVVVVMAEIKYLNQQLLNTIVRTPLFSIFASLSRFSYICQTIMCVVCKKC